MTEKEALPPDLWLYHDSTITPDWPLAVWSNRVTDGGCTEYVRSDIAQRMLDDAITKLLASFSVEREELQNEIRLHTEYIFLDFDGTPLPIPKDDGKALDPVLIERLRQEKKWGTQNHPPSRYFAILMEEIGEVAKELTEFLASDLSVDRALYLDRLRTELVQAAAVSLAFIGCLDRNAWPAVHSEEPR